MKITYLVYGVADIIGGVTISARATSVPGTYSATVWEVTHHPEGRTSTRDRVVSLLLPEGPTSWKARQVAMDLFGGAYYVTDPIPEVTVNA